MRRVFLGLLCVSALAMLTTTHRASAGPIAPGSFINPIVDDFTALGLPVTNAGPLIRPEGTYTFQPTTFRYLDAGGPPYFGELIGTNAQTGFIDIVLNQPTVRAGVWLGASSGTVEFFDPNGISQGVVPYLSPGVGLTFYGWDSGSDPIARIRVTDTNALDGAVTFLDRTTTEAVPEPATGALIISALCALRRRRVR